MDRAKLTEELIQMELALKELEILYEKYFAGVQKLEPVKERTSLQRKIHHFVNHSIPQTDLKFRYQGIATRYHSYSNYWDRILRMIDEGRFIRDKNPNQRRRFPQASPPASPSASQSPANSTGKASEVDHICSQLQKAKEAGKINGNTPSREHITQLIQRQQEKIREKFGDKQVEFSLDIEAGKPKIKVRQRK